MTTNFSTESEVLRLRRVENWPIGTVARTLGIHHSVVRRIEGGFQKEQSRLPRSKITDDFVPFIQETIERYPKVKASRIFSMLKERGYPGISKGHLRRLVRKLRPRPTPEAFLRLCHLSGEEGQVDWGEFGRIAVEGGTRKLYAFALTLPHSRALFVKFFLGVQQGDFEEGFEEAFAFFEGAPRKIVLDNLRTGVSERFLNLVRYNSHFLAMTRHYGCEVQACRPRRGNEKGTIEKSIGYIRDNFFEARPWKDLEDLNAQVRDWCLGESLERVWKRGDPRTVGELFAAEKQRLLPLPPTSFPVGNAKIVRIPKTPYARFDTNDYSVPAQYVQSSLSLRATTREVLIFDGATEVARHPRSYACHKTIETPSHIESILVQKRAARRQAGQHRLVSAVAPAERFLESLALSGQNMGGAVFSLLRLLDLYGSERLSRALAEVVKSGSSQLRSVHLVLRRLETETTEGEPPVNIAWGEKVPIITVQHHDLAHYDRIANKGEAHE